MSYLDFCSVCEVTWRYSSILVIDHVMLLTNLLHARRHLHQAQLAYVISG